MKGFAQGDHVVNVITNEVGQILERYSPVFNPHYVDYIVIFKDRDEVVKLRHLRRAMSGEKRIFLRLW